MNKEVKTMFVCCCGLWLKRASMPISGIDPVVTISAWGTTERSAIEVLQVSNCN